MLQCSLYLKQIRLKKKSGFQNKPFQFLKREVKNVLNLPLDQNSFARFQSFIGTHAMQTRLEKSPFRFVHQAQRKSIVISVLYAFKFQID